jgi:hypothetical protein
MIKNRFAKLQRKDDKKNGKKQRRRNLKDEWPTIPAVEPASESVLELDLPFADFSMLDGALGDAFVCGDEPWDMRL